MERTEMEAMKADIAALGEDLSTVQAENAALTEAVGQLRLEVETYGGMVLSIPEAQAGPVEAPAAQGGEFMQALGSEDGQDAAVSAQNAIVPDEPGGETAEGEPGGESEASKMAASTPPAAEPEAAEAADAPSGSTGQGADSGKVTGAAAVVVSDGQKPGNGDKGGAAGQAEASSNAVDSQGRSVYITATGSKYHYSDSCNGGTYYASTLSEALAKGLTPCKKCAGG